MIDAVNYKRPLLTVSFSGKVSSAANEIPTGTIGKTVNPATAMLATTSQGLPAGTVSNIIGNKTAQQKLVALKIFK